jgi:hypothetical protein
MQVATMVMMSCCATERSLTDMMDQLSGNEAVLDRITMITATPISYNRLFSKSLARIDDRAKHIRASYAPRDERPRIDRKVLARADEPTDGAGESIELADKSWKGTSHRDVEVRSVIDYHLWNNAGWKGAFYMVPSAGPPFIAFLFTNGEAARGIFGRWRERFGKVDANEEIYLSVIRDVSEEHPAHYTLLISSRPERRSLKPAGTMFMSRFHRMESASDENIVRFLAAYHQAGAYVLMPAVLDSGEPTPLFDLAIMKKELAVKSTKFLDSLDVEQCAVGPSVEALYTRQRKEPV